MVVTGDTFGDTNFITANLFVLLLYFKWKLYLIYKQNVLPLNKENIMLKNNGKKNTNFAVIHLVSPKMAVTSSYCL